MCQAFLRRIEIGHKQLLNNCIYCNLKQDSQIPDRFQKLHEPLCQVEKFNTLSIKTIVLEREISSCIYLHFQKPFILFSLFILSGKEKRSAVLSQTFTEFQVFSDLVYGIQLGIGHTIPDSHRDNIKLKHFAIMSILPFLTNIFCLIQCYCDNFKFETEFKLLNLMSG